MTILSKNTARSAAVKAAGTSISPTGAVGAVNVGDTILVSVTFDNLTTTTPTVNSISKPSGETAVWTRRANINATTASAAAGIRVEMWSITVAVATNWTTFVPAVTLSSSVTAKAVALCVLQSDAPISFASAQFASDPGGAPVATNLGNAIGQYVWLAGASEKNSSVGTVILTGSNGFLSQSNSNVNSTGQGSATNVALNQVVRNSDSANSSASLSIGASNSHVVAVLLTELLPVAPTPRTLVGTVTSDTTVYLTWDDDAAAYPDPTYEIQKSTDGTNFTTHATGQISQTSYSVTGLTTGQQYWFKIRGTNASGTSSFSNTVTATPAAFSMKNTFEGGSNLAQITEFDTFAGDRPFDFYNAQQAPIYDDSIKYNGALSGKAEFVGANGSSMFGWDSPVALDYSYTRFYMYMTGGALQYMPIVNYYDFSGVVMGAVELTPANELRIRAGTSDVSTMTMPLFQWIRVETYVDWTFPTMMARVYTTDPSAPAGSYDDELLLSNASGLTGFIKKVAFGVGANSGAYSGPIWFDDIAVGTPTTWFGPTSAPPPATLNAGMFGMIPIF